MSDFLPKDVLIEILLRLPPKSLVQCTCICRSWYALITKPSFISEHLSRTVSCSSSTTEESLHFARHYDMFRKSKNEFFRIVGSCHGLICLSDDYDTYTDTLILWNPLIRRSVKVPQPRIDYYGSGCCLWEFGYDFRINDYKVVRIVYNSKLPENLNLDSPLTLEVPNSPKKENCRVEVRPEVEVYTSRTGTWRVVANNTASPSSFVYNTYTGSPAFVEGALHWVASSNRDGNGSRSLIVAFELADEEFGEIKIPECVAGKNVSKLSVMAFGASLALIDYDKFWKSDHCRIWVMDSYGIEESWSKKITVDLRGGLRDVVGFRRNGDVLVSARVNGLKSFDPNSKELSYLGIHGTNRSFYAESFVGSVTLLDVRNGVSEVTNSDGNVAEDLPVPDQ